MYRGSRIGVVSHVVTIAFASSTANKRRAERQHVGAVVLARVPGDGLGRRHRRADAAILFAAIAEPIPAPSMTMPASASPRATARPTDAATSG